MWGAKSWVRRTGRALAASDRSALASSLALGPTTWPWPSVAPLQPSFALAEARLGKAIHGRRSLWAKLCHEMPGFVKWVQTLNGVATAPRCSHPQNGKNNGYIYQKQWIYIYIYIYSHMFTTTPTQLGGPWSVHVMIQHPRTIRGTIRLPASSWLKNPDPTMAGKWFGFCYPPIQIEILHGSIHISINFMYI